MSKNTPPLIEELKLKDLIVDIALSGRSEKEITTNAKNLAPLMTAFGGWDSSQPGEYFVREGKPHIAAGFTRKSAAELAGIKTGYFVQVPDDPAKLRTACIRTNQGNRVSPFEQGRIFNSMKEGMSAEGAPVGTTILGPMTTQEIADELGITRQWVENCIAIFTETPEIAQLIVDGKISANIAVKAKQQLKDDAKRLKWLTAAYKLALSDGKETATMKHLDACKSDFIPLKAASNKPVTQEPPAPTNDNESSGNEPQEKEESAPSQPSPQSSLDLGAPQHTPSKKDKANVRASLITALSSLSDELNWAATDDDLERAADKLIGDGLIVPELPF